MRVLPVRPSRPVFSIFSCFTIVAIAVVLIMAAGAVRPAAAQVSVTVIAPSVCLPIVPVPGVQVLPAATLLPNQAQRTTPFCLPGPRPPILPPITVIAVDPGRPLPPIMENGVVIRNLTATVNIADQIANTRLSLEFFNPGNGPAEGSNLIPLPLGATVTDLSLIIDGQPVSGQLLDAEQARQIYEENVRRLRDPALLSYSGQGAVQVNIFPIPPGQTRTVIISYSQLLNADNGLISYTLPLRTDYLSHNPIQQGSISLTLTSSGPPIGATYSPDAAILIARQDDHRVQAGFERVNFTPDADFQFYYSLNSNATAGSGPVINASLITYRASADEDGYFLLLLTPPLTVTAAQVIPRDVLIVLDQSGSMQGAKWSQAQAAAQFVLSHLNPQDRFNVLVFSTGTRIFANSLQPVDQAQSAAAWIQTQRAEGGTDINGALSEALHMADLTRQTTVLFMTDGQPTEGVTDFPTLLSNAQKNAGSNTRLFAFGVGDDVNTYLLDSLAAELHGTSVYIRPSENLETKISSLYARISAPVLISPKLVFSGSVVINDTYPNDLLPDIFAGQQLVISGRYHGQGTPTVTLSGDQGGQSQSFSFPNLTFGDNAGGSPFVAQLWATRKIGTLLQAIRLHGETSELVDEVRALSIRYGIVTPYTSYLVQENSGRSDSGMATPIPAYGLAPSAQTGAAAIDAAQQSGGMAGAAAVPAAQNTSSPAANATLPVRQIGDRAFVLRGGVWVDTQYTPKAGDPAPTAIAFGSDAYFAFVNAHPTLADALALGSQVTIVVNGTAYAITTTGQN